MPSLVSTILKSLPIMFDVMVLFFFMLIMFGTIATQLLGGHLENRCTATINGKNYKDFGRDLSYEIICQNDADCVDSIDKAFPGFNETYPTCQYYGNPM